MNRTTSATACAAALLFAAAVLAQAPVGAPAGATGSCKDGSYTTAANKKGACRGHQGVKEWYAASTAAPAGTASAPAPRATAKPTATAAPGATGATGVCNDGTPTTARNKKGACRGHQGVKDWYGSGAAAAAPAATSAPPATAAPPPAPAPAAPAAPAPSTVAAVRSAYTMPTTAAPGGGADQVWVNKSTRVYHCPGDKWYGKTKSGEYLSESAAQAQGFHPDHGKVCTH
jgi:hypothetical protein